MVDPRMRKLADVLVGYSTKVQPGERVLIEATDAPAEMVALLVDRVAQAGGLPFAQVIDPRVSRALYMNATEEQCKVYGKRDLEFMQQMQAYIALRGGMNINETSDVPDEKRLIYQEHWTKPVSDWRVSKSKWVVLRWPTPSMAQLAGMSTEQFENFYFDVCNLDYAKMAEAEKPLKERMERADVVHIVGPKDNDLTFSIKGIPAIQCDGDRNIPDGEVFTAPVRDSINGVIHYNAGTVYQGKSFDDVRLVFEKGKVVEATSSDTEVAQRDTRYGRGREIRRRVQPGVQSLHQQGHARHSVRREDRRLPALHTGPGLQRGRQRQSLENPLGPCADSDAGVRRRGDMVRRGVDPQGRAVRAWLPAGAEPGEPDLSAACCFGISASLKSRNTLQAGLRRAAPGG